MVGGASGTAQRVEGEGDACTAFGVIQYILRKL